MCLKWEFPVESRKIAHAHAFVVVTYYIKLLRTGVDRQNGLSTSVLLLVAEATSHHLCYLRGGIHTKIITKVKESIVGSVLVLLLFSCSKVILSPSERAIFSFIFFRWNRANVRKNKQPRKVFLKSVLQVNKIYRSIQKLCSTRNIFAQGLFCNYLKKVCKRESF